MKNSHESPFVKPKLRPEQLNAVKERQSVRAVAGSNVTIAAKRTFPNIELSDDQIKQLQNIARDEEAIVANIIKDTPPETVENSPYYANDTAPSPVLDLAAARREVQNRISTSLQDAAVAEITAYQNPGSSNQNIAISPTFVDDARNRVTMAYTQRDVSNRPDQIRPENAQPFTTREAA